MPYVEADTILACLLRRILPSGGHVVQMVEAYFDESGTHSGSQVLCVAGYIFEKNKCTELDKELMCILEKYKLPYFRMSSCAHGTKPLNALFPLERIDCETAIISAIHKHAIRGFAVTVEPEKYDSIVTERRHFGSPYSFCARTCLTAVASWIKEADYKGDVAYFFASGHKSQSESNRIMDEVFAVPFLKVKYHYVAHTFADMRVVRPLQASDLLAWQWYTDHKNRLRTIARPVRADCLSLMDGLHHSTMHWESWMLDAMNERQRLRAIQYGQKNDTNAKGQTA